MGVLKLFLIIHVGCTLFIMEAYCEGTLLFTSMSDLNVRVKIQQTVDWNNTSFYPSIHLSVFSEVFPENAVVQTASGSAEPSVHALSSPAVSNGRKPNKLKKHRQHSKTQKASSQSDCHIA